MPVKQPRNELASIDRSIQRLTNLKPGKKRAAPTLPKLKHILVALDPASDYNAALSWAEALCRFSGTTRVTLATALDSEDMLADLAASGGRADVAALMQREQQEAEAAFRAGEKRLAAVTKSVKRTVLRGFPSQEIVYLAQRTKPDLVIVGSHGHGRMERAMLGSVADAIKNHVTCHVLIAKQPASSGPVLVPVDGSERSRKAALLGLRLAEAWNETTHILYVFGLGFLRYAEIGEDEFRAMIQKERLPPASAKVHYALDFGNPAKQIVAYATERTPAIIVMGSRGLGAIGSAVLGGVSNRVSHDAPVTCLFLKS